LHHNVESKMMGLNQWNWVVERANTGSVEPKGIVRENIHCLSKLKFWPSPSLQHTVSLKNDPLLLNHEKCSTKRGSSNPNSGNGWCKHLMQVNKWWTIILFLFKIIEYGVSW